MLKEKIRIRNWAAKKTKQVNAQIIIPQPNGENLYSTNYSTLNVACQILANKHSIVILKRLICPKTQTKLKLSKGPRQNRD